MKQKDGYFLYLYLIWKIATVVCAYVCLWGGVVAKKWEFTKLSKYLSIGV